MISINSRIALTGCAALCLLSADCSRPAEQFGTAYNDVRRSLGIPILPSDWRPRSPGKALIAWYNPQTSDFEKRHAPFHASKEISYPNDSLAYELDIYDGSGRYTSIDGTFSEQLRLEYFYRSMPDRRNATAGWRCTITDSLQVDGTHIDLKQADSIMAAWGLSRQ